ncbi:MULTISPECIES: hypothetical protein [Mesorhizobium]|uniref:Uncharacterized protein n=1 Tax=Mesorhizobium denitrificans TaxID=2294114 RepID=A0A371X6N4_9HYPH|nr:MULTISPECIES: hypothetical protein [Mesorhizobium]RFC64694.1 hypothetical protein DY251_18965 [Mesorhizobium denitrificans]
MLYVDIPTHSEIAYLGRHRADACVSIYLETTPQTQHIDAARIAFANLSRNALHQLEAVGFDKRNASAISDQLQAFGEDDEFWAHQGHSLCVFVTPETLRSYRLANRLTTGVHVSDRFHLKPLLRSVTFAGSGLVLALAENGVRLIRLYADQPAEEIRVADMPKDAASYAGKSTLNDRTDVTRSGGPDGQKMRLRQYARRIDELLRPVLKGSETPLILAATEPLASIYRSINSYEYLATETLATSPGEMTPAQLETTARPVLDGLYAEEVERIRRLMDQRSGQGRTILDVAHAARAATACAIDTLMVDIDAVVPGFVDEASGLVTFAEKDDARAYDVIDEVAVRALLSGARVLAVRAEDLPEGAAIAAITRYAI